MSALDRFARQLSWVHPISYLFLYLTVIPVYGLLYTYASPHGFYAPYSRYEPAAARDLEHLSRIIELEITRLSHYSADMELTVDRKHIFLNTMQIDHLNSADGSSIIFRLGFPIASDRRMTFDEARSGRAFTIIPGLFKYAQITATPELALKDVAGEYTLRDLHFIKTPNDSVMFSGYADMVFNKLIDSNNECQLFTTCILFMTHREDEQTVQNYLNSVQGDPFAVSDIWSRMFYLSAVIITTLGLGDIVPISRLSRMLVATEALSGIVLAGLFLNALAYRAANPDPKASSAVAAPVQKS